MPKKSVARAAKPKKTTPPITQAAKAPPKTRRLSIPKYQSFKLQKRIKTGPKLVGSFRLMGQAFATLGRNWKVFLGIVLIFGLLNILLVRSFTGSANFTSIKQSMDTLIGGNFGQLAGGTALFIYLLGSSGNTASPTAGAYQLILTLVTSLAIIWVLRELYGKRTVRVRDGFYHGMTPLVTFILVLLVIGLQLLPLAIGVLLYTAVVTNGIAVSFIEQSVWVLVFLVLMMVSLYMITSSIFALYIVTLQNTTPLQALRSARQLVAARRWTVMRKLLFLPLALIVLSAAIIMPFILYATPAAPWAFFLMSMLILPVIHSYLYTLYRSLL